MEVWLIRHGETAANASRRYSGATDDPLTPEGAAALRPLPGGEGVTRVYVTDLVRTGQTAAILFPGAAQTVIPAFDEMNFGAFEGRTADEMADDPAYCAWVAGDCVGETPGGESMASFQARVCAGFRALMDAVREEPLAAVCHGGTIMALMAAYGRPAKAYYEWYVGNGRGLRLRAEKRGGTWELTVLSALDGTAGERSRE